MKPQRAGEAGVSLVEMLAALVISAMIGVAGFTLLDGMTTRDAQVSGRLELVLRRDRAFRLLQIDASAARIVRTTDAGGVAFETAGYLLTWRADGDGLRREIAYPRGTELVQRVLSEPAALQVTEDGRSITLRLTEAELRRIFAVPGQAAP